MKKCEVGIVVVCLYKFFDFLKVQLFYIAQEVLLNISKDHSGMFSSLQGPQRSHYFVERYHFSNQSNYSYKKKFR